MRQIQNVKFDSTLNCNGLITKVSFKGMQGRLNPIEFLFDWPNYTNWNCILKVFLNVSKCLMLSLLPRFDVLQGKNHNLDKFLQFFLENATYLNSRRQDFKTYEMFGYIKSLIKNSLIKNTIYMTNIIFFW